MSNLREIIIDHVRYLLEGILQPTFNTTPHVERDRVIWEQTVNFPALYLDEGETEEVEHFAMGTEQGILNLIIMGKIRSNKIDFNKFIEDVRKRLDDSSTNSYWQWTHIQAVRTFFDPESELKEFEMPVKIQYQYNTGSA